MERVKKYIHEGETIKLKLPHIWKYDDELESLKRLIDNTNLPEIMIADRFRSMKISNFNTFAEYIKHEDITTISVTFPTVIKTSVNLIRCSDCHNVITSMKDGQSYCEHCKKIIAQKSDGNLTTQEIADPSKHQMKQLKMITHEIKWPASIEKILPYITLWFSDKSYLKTYLEFAKKKQLWFKKYRKFTGREIDDSFFETELENVQSNYNLFKMYTDVFYEMTNDMMNYRNRESNMSSFGAEKICEICQKYYDFYKTVPILDHDAPNTFPFEIDGREIECEIGNFIARQLVIDLNYRTNLKQRLRDIFKIDLKLPGLMFCYDEVFIGKKKIKTPAKYNYQQYYAAIINKVYGIPFESISNVDKQLICDIMMDFNDFIQNIKKDTTGKKGNSILWDVNLRCVLQLPYFRCYKNIYKFLPSKNSPKIDPIYEYWTSYLVRNDHKMSMYKYTLREEKDTSQESNSRISAVDYEVSNQELIDYLTDTGSSYQHTKKDEYYKEKLNIVDKKLEWKDQVTLNSRFNFKKDNESSSIVENEETETNEYYSDDEMIFDDDFEEDESVDNDDFEDDYEEDDYEEEFFEDDF